MTSDAPHGPGRTLGRVAVEACRSLSRHGVEPSGGGWVAAPGQRRERRSAGREALRRWRIGRERAGPVGLSVNWKALKIGWTRA